MSRWGHRQTSRRGAQKAAREALGEREYQQHVDRAQAVEGSGGCAVAVMAFTIAFGRMRGWL